MSSLKRIAGAFVLLFTIVLAVALTLLTLVGTDAAMSDREIYLRAAIAVLASAGITGILIMLCKVSVITISRLLKHLLGWITIQTVRKAIMDYSITVQATGIASIEGSLVVGLEIGSEAGVKVGEQFVVSNATNQQTLGVVEVFRLYEGSSVCKVIDWTNDKFWSALELRMDQDPSFPTGVAITRDSQEDALLQSLQNLLASWRG